MNPDSDMGKIVEVRCSLKRPARQRSQTADPASTALPIVDAMELRAKLPRITHTVARALMFEHAIANGEAADFADLARLTATTRERVSQVMKMMRLAPDIQDEILRLTPRRRSQRAITVPEVTAIAEEIMWDDQRESWRKLKQQNGLGEE
ncbi:MAG: hypothetical protein NTY38_08765 [Acidobacteria bacterium]|nr:hypothetical protein [Acidobacteriota bacterium]